MVCSLVKKSLVGAALGAGALFLVFGTHAPSYIRTAFCKVRQSAKDSVPLQFDIERARQEIADLKPMFDQNKETLARAEIETEHLEREVVTIQANLDKERKTILALRHSLETGEFRLASHGGDTAKDIKAELAHRKDHFDYTSDLLTQKQATLKAKKNIIQSANEQLENLRTQKSTLLARLAKIEAALKNVEATSSKNEFNFDGTALARAKQTVSELEERLDVMARRAEIEGRFGEFDQPSAYVADPQRDIVKEIDEQFGKDGSRPAPKTADKSL